MTLVFALLVYALAMTAANIGITIYGPVLIPINAFLLIGLDLSLRDWLHLKLGKLEMLALIAFSGLLTYALNPASGSVAIASTAAFALAALVDWKVFVTVNGSWKRKCNYSNAAGAAVDSIVFPLVAFGTIAPAIVISQFAAKILGGFLWSLILVKLSKDRTE